MEKYELCVNDITSPIKIRDYMKNHLGFSTSLIARVKFGGVYLNGEEVHMRAIVSPGDKICILYPEEDSENIKPINIPLDIVYEDEYILAVNKPINMPVHPSKGNSLPTLANAVRAYLDRPFVFRAVNRLDRDTSGIVLIAKDPLTGAKLCRSIKNGGLGKKYIAIVKGVPNSKSGVINAPIERLSEGNIKRVVRTDGKESITEYKVLSTTVDGNSICEIIPITGRTHQIRVHMAHIGHPLINDFLYGERVDNQTYKLHCYLIEFDHPYSDEKKTLLSPPDFY